MDDDIVAKYIEKLINSNISKHDVLLMVYDFLKDRYSSDLRSNISDSLRHEQVQLDQPEEISVVDPIIIDQAIPAHVVSTYYLQELAKRTNQ